MRKLTIITCAALLALGLSGCGRKGDLAPPPALVSVDMDANHASL